MPTLSLKSQKKKTKENCPLGSRKYHKSLLNKKEVRKKVVRNDINDLEGCGRKIRLQEVQQPCVRDENGQS